MLNVVATLQQRCGNVLITSESDVVTTSETDVGTTLIFDRFTTLWQRQQRRCDNVVTTLCVSWVATPRTIFQLLQIILDGTFNLRLTILFQDQIFDV